MNHLATQESYGAYLPGRRPELLVASASSDTSDTVVEKVFTKVAAEHGHPLKVTDTAPTADGDPTGQGIFFLLVVPSIGSYAWIAVIGGAGAVLALRVSAALVIAAFLGVSLGDGSGGNGSGRPRHRRRIRRRVDVGGMSGPPPRPGRTRTRS